MEQEEINKKVEEIKGMSKAEIPEEKKELIIRKLVENNQPMYEILQILDGITQYDIEDNMIDNLIEALERGFEVRTYGHHGSYMDPGWSSRKPPYYDIEKSHVWEYRTDIGEYGEYDLGINVLR